MARTEILTGPGLFVWKARNFGDGLPDQLADLGFRHVLFKVLDDTRERTPDLKVIERLMPRLRENSITVGFWKYYYAGDPVACARKAVEVCNRYAVRAFVANAEKEMKAPKGSAARKALSDKARAFAETFWQTVGTADEAQWELALSTFALTRLHGEFVYEAWLAHEDDTRDVDTVMGQCYGSNPLEQVKESVPDLTKWGERAVPTMRAYLGDGNSSVAKVVSDLREFYAYAASDEGARQFNGFNFWELEAMLKHPAMASEIKILNAAYNRRAPWIPQPLPVAPIPVEPSLRMAILLYDRNGEFVSESARSLQTWLNATFSAGLKADGWLGEKSSSAFYTAFQMWLRGDPREASVIAAPVPPPAEIDASRIALLNEGMADIENGVGRIREALED